MAFKYHVIQILLQFLNIYRFDFFILILTIHLIKKYIIIMYFNYNMIYYIIVIETKRNPYGCNHNHSNFRHRIRKSFIDCLVMHALCCTEALVRE
jgi:hypothetical protein